MPKCSQCKVNRKRLFSCHICGDNLCGCCSFKRDNGKRVCPGICHALSRSQDIVSYNGQSFRTIKTAPPCPDFTLMESIEVRLWLIKFTYARGYSKAPNALSGYAGANIGVNQS